jgi:hypothetical protein
MVGEGCQHFPQLFPNMRRRTLMPCDRRAR